MGGTGYRIVKVSGNDLNDREVLKSTWNYEEATGTALNHANKTFNELEEGAAYMEKDGNDLIEIRRCEDGLLIVAVMIEEFEQS